MAVARPPWGWRVRDEAGRTVFVGFDFGFVWPFVALYAGGFLLGFPTLGSSVAFWLGATACASLLGLMRGFRLQVGPRGFTLWRTWCGAPYRCIRVPLDARVEAVGGFGDSPDRMVIERGVCSEDISLGSRSTCEALCEAVRRAQERWRSGVA